MQRLYSVNEDEKMTNGEQAYNKCHLSDNKVKIRTGYLPNISLGCCGFVISYSCSKHGKQNCIQNSDRLPEGKRSLGRPRRRWKDTTRMDLRKIG